MTSNDMPCSPYLNRPMRSLHVALADRIQIQVADRRYSPAHHGSTLVGHSDLIISALRAYKGK